MTKSYYFGSGMRRHKAISRDGHYVRLACGMAGYVGLKLQSSRAEANCKLCRRKDDA